MSILTLIAPVRNVNPTTSANPRDSWPEWTDEDCWELTLDPEGHRPTADPDFEPSDEEQVEASQLFNDDQAEPTDAEWEAMADEAHSLDVVCSGVAWL